MRIAWLFVLVACGGPSTPHKPVPAVENGAFRLAVEGTEVTYTVKGQGPTCIVHPGGPGFSSSYLRAADFERANLTAIYLDPLGTGPSGKLPATEEYSRERDARVIEALRAKLGQDKICLIGHSYGGMVVLEYAKTHPEHVSALLLYSTSAVTDAAWEKEVGQNLQAFKGQPWFADSIKAFEEEGKTTDPTALTAIFQRELPFFFADWTGHTSAYQPLTRDLQLSPDVYTRRARGKAHDYDVRRRLGALHLTPTVVIAGDKDPITSVKDSSALASEVAGSTLIVIKEAGHFAHWEQPTEFQDAVRRFAAKLH